MNSKASVYTRKLTVVAVMTALMLVCSGTFPYGLTFRVGDFMKMSPSFIIVGITANMYGWKEAGLVALLSDVIQGLVFGNLSVLIALINMMSGVIFGIMLYNSKSVLRITVAVLVTQIVGSLFLITAVLCIRYGIPLVPTVYWRALQTAILIAVETGVLCLVIRKIDIVGKLNRPAAN